MTKPPQPPFLPFSAVITIGAEAVPLAIIFDPGVTINADANLGFEL